MTATIIARSVHGLEWVAADEIVSRLPSATELRLSRREVIFRLPSVDHGLFDLSTVDDVFLQVGQIGDVGTSKDAARPLAKRLALLDWAHSLSELRRLREIPRLPQFDVVASIEGRRNYSRFTVENEVGSALASVIHGSYLERTPEGRKPGSPGLTVRVFLRGSAAIVALRLSARPLHRREYKQDTATGTLHPPVAAAMVRLANPSEHSLLLDPFAGDGTISIEAARAHHRMTILATDIDQERIANVQRNARRAGAAVAVAVADAGRPPLRPGSFDLVVTNPPWNLAVDARGSLEGSLDSFWRNVPALLGPGARLSLVTSAELDVPGTLRQLGYRPAMEARIRLAGRVSNLLLCSPPGETAPNLPPGLRHWRRQAIAAGVITEEGF